MEIKGIMDESSQRRTETLTFGSHTHTQSAIPTRGEEVLNDYQHLAPIIQERIHEHEVEEITRTKHIEIHHHHIQYHLQPLMDTATAPTTHSQTALFLPTFHTQYTMEDQSSAIQGYMGFKSSDVGSEDNKSSRSKGIGRVQDTYHVHHHVQPVTDQFISRNVGSESTPTTSGTETTSSSQHIASGAGNIHSLPYAQDQLGSHHGISIIGGVGAESRGTVA